jgi:hypothetical protein
VKITERLETVVFFGGVGRSFSVVTILHLQQGTISM